MFDNPWRDLKRLQDELLAVEEPEDFSLQDEPLIDIQNMLLHKKSELNYDSNQLSGRSSVSCEPGNYVETSPVDFVSRSHCALPKRKRYYRRRYRLVLSILILENLLLVVYFLWHWIQA